MNIITIDGPVASGKSTTAESVAKKLGYSYLSTGFLYRAIAYVLVNKFNYNKNNLYNLSEIDLRKILNKTVLNYEYDLQYGSKLFYKNENIINALKDSSIDFYASIISPIIFVRQNLFNFMHELVLDKKFVVDGRDMGSHVFVESKNKFYLTASLDERAVRWQKLQENRNNKFSFEQSKNIILQRDFKDIFRKHAPLVVPKGAFIIDNTFLGINSSAKKIIFLLK